MKKGAKSIAAIASDKSLIQIENADSSHPLPIMALPLFDFGDFILDLADRLIDFC